jgi:hypothetical protein
MADNITIFNRAGNQVVQNLTGGITMNETHDAKNTVTSQTLENGSPLVDHIIIEADEITVSLLFTNFDGHGKPLEGEMAKTAWQELKRLRNNRELLEVVTLHEIYTNMAIVSINAKHDAPYKGQLNIELQLKKIDQTNLNIGKGDPSKFKKTSDKVKSLLDVAMSAITPQNLGKKDPVDSPSVSKKVIPNWYDKNWAKTKDLYNKASAGYEKAMAKKALAVAAINKSAHYIQVAKNMPTNIQTQIGDKTMEFSTVFNNLDSSWSLNVSNINEGWTLSGLKMSPGVNLLEGYLVDSPIDNLYVVELVDGSSSTTGAWGDDGVQESDSAVQPPCVLVYFDAMPPEESVLKDLAFSLDEMDYTIIDPPDTPLDFVFLGGAGPILKYAGQDYRLLVIAGAIAVEGPLSSVSVGVSDDVEFADGTGPVLKYDGNDYRIVMTDDAIIGVEGPLEDIRAGSYSDLVFVEGKGPVIKFGEDDYRIVMTGDGVVGVEGPL